MKSLVIGGAGFIGSHIVRRLMKGRHKIFLFDNFSRSGSQINVDCVKGYVGLKIINGDVRKISSVENIFKKYGPFDLIFHQAAQVAVTKSIEDPRHDFEVNAMGTFNVLEAARKLSKKSILLYASTNKVYGKLDHLKISERKTRYVYAGRSRGVSEAENLDFYSPYGCSKGIADQYVRDYFRTYGLRTVVFRQSCIYGPWQFGMEDQGWVAWFILASLLGKPLTIYGNGKQVRDVLYIDDLIDLYFLAIEKIEISAGQIYNAGGGMSHTLSLFELVRMIKGYTADEVKLSFKKPRLGDQRVFISDIGKAKSELGWRPRISAEEGTRRLYAWALGHRDLIVRAFGGAKKL